MTSPLRHERAGPDGINTCAGQAPCPSYAHKCTDIPLLNQTLVLKLNTACHSISYGFEKRNKVEVQSSVTDENNSQPTLIWTVKDVQMNKIWIQTQMVQLWSDTEAQPSLCILSAPNTQIIFPSAVPYGRFDRLSHFLVTQRSGCCTCWINGDLSSFTQPIIPVFPSSLDALAIWLPSFLRIYGSLAQSCWHHQISLFMIRGTGFNSLN